MLNFKEMFHKGVVLGTLGDTDKGRGCVLSPMLSTTLGEGQRWPRGSSFSEDNL